MNEHARRYPAGNIPATADFRDCCRNISEQASRSTNDGGVGAGAGGPHWSHDALGAYTYFDYSYTASMKKHLQNAFAHSSLPHSCCKKYFGQLHDSTAQGRWHAGVLRGHPPLGEETLDGVHAGHRHGRPDQRRKLRVMGGNVRHPPWRVVRAHGTGLHAVLRPADLGPQGETTQPSPVRRGQPHRDAADPGCTVECKCAALAQNHRGRLQDDAVAAGDRTFVRLHACAAVTLRAFVGEKTAAAAQQQQKQQQQ